MAGPPWVTEVVGVEVAVLVGMMVVAEGVDSEVLAEPIGIALHRRSREVEMGQQLAAA